MMLKDREELELNLQERIREIKPSRKKTNQVNNILREYGVPLGTYSEIVKGEKPISNVPSSLLCLVTEALHITTGYGDIDPLVWFTDKEIDTARKQTINIFKDESRIMLPLAIEDVTFLGDASYITKIDMPFLVQLFHSQLIIYDFDTQRSAKWVKRKDGVVPVPDINMKSVEDIASSMVNETYLEDMITLNIYSGEVEPLTYNQKSKLLTINEGAVISILDGFHRLQGGVRAMTINPELKQMMILSIRSYDTQTAQRYFGQINTINPVKIERRKELLSDQPSDLVVRDLQLKSELKGKIASASNISIAAKQLTTFDIMSYAIDNVFNPSNKLEAKETAEYLINYYDYLLGSFVDEFLENPAKYRETFINHPLMFIGYTVIAKYFLDAKIHPKNIKDYVSNLKLSNDELTEIFTDTRRGINSPVLRRKVLSYFKSLVGGGIDNVE